MVSWILSFCTAQKYSLYDALKDFVTGALSASPVKKYKDLQKQFPQYTLLSKHGNLRNH